MRKPLKRKLSFFLSLCLLLGMFSFGGLTVSAAKIAVEVSADAKGDTIKGTIPAPKEFGANYVVTNPNTQIGEIGDDMVEDDFIINLRSNADAPANAEALVFRFSIPNISGAAFHVGYWNFSAFGDAFTGTSAKSGGLYTDYAIYYYEKEKIYAKESASNVWAGLSSFNWLPINCEGYVVVRMADLQPFAQAKFGKNVTVADIEEMTFRQEWYWDKDLYNKQLYLSDVGYVMDVEKFEADFLDFFPETRVPAYEKGVLDPTGDITLKADRVEGTFAKLSWNAFKGAHRYRIAVYTKEGLHYTEQIRETSYTLEGLNVNTDYKVQVAPIDTDKQDLGASNVLAFKTAAKNTEPYKNGLLEYDKAMTAVVEKDVVTWKWIDGVDHYAIHLYEKNGDTVIFRDRFTINSKKGNYKLSSLDKGKKYLVQLVSYTADNSIVAVYVPVETSVAAAVVGSSTTNDDKGNHTTSTVPLGTTKDDATVSTGSHTATTVPTSGDNKGDVPTTERDTATTVSTNSDNSNITTTTTGNTGKTTAMDGKDVDDNNSLLIGVVIVAGVLGLVALVGVVIVTSKRRQQRINGSRSEESEK